MTSSAKLAHIASKGMKITRHGQLTLAEIRELAASVESQRQDDPSTRQHKSSPKKPRGR